MPSPNASVQCLRIVLINSRYPPDANAGPAYSVQALAHGLHQLGHEVHVIHRTGIPQPHRTQDQGVHLLQIPTPDYLTDPSPVVDDYLREVNPHIVNTHLLMDFSATGLWQRINAMGIPLVHTLRAWFLVCKNGGRYHDGLLCDANYAPCQAHTNIMANFTPCIDGMVAISHAILDGHQDLGGIPDGMPTTVIYNSHEPPATLPAPMPRVQSTVRFGFLGRLFPLKGIELLLSVFSRPEFVPVELWVAGKGPERYEAKLRQLATDNVTFCGYVERDEWLPHIDVLITPSLCLEALGRVVIEAKFHGKPAITSQRGGLEELIEPGVTGWTFDPQDPEQLVNILRDIVTQPGLAHAMTPAVRESFAPFGILPIADQYADFYHQIISSHAQSVATH